MDTNSPPTQSSVSIAPETGLALITQFMFMATLAQDQDKPVIYSYGIQFNETSLTLGRGNGLLSFAHILPFNEEIHIFSEACDTYGACSKVFGQNVGTQLPTNITLDFVRDELDFLESALDRMEYNSSFNRIIIYGVTLLRVPDFKLFQEFKSNIVQLIRAENIKLLPLRKDGTVHFTDEEVLDYLGGVKLIMELLDIRDKEIILSSIDLVETILVKIDSINETRDIKRRRRQIQSNPDGMISDKVYLEALEQTGNLLDKLLPNDSTIFENAKYLSKQMCYFKVGEEQNYQTVKLRTFKQGHEYSNFSTTDFATSHQDGAWTASARLGDVYELDEDTNDYCVATFFDAKGHLPIYQWLVFERKKNQSQYFQVLKTRANNGPNTNGPNTVRIQINLNGTFKSDQLQCQMMLNTSWNKEICATDTSDPTKLICSCAVNQPVSFDVLRNVSLATNSTGEKIVVPNPNSNQIVTSLPTTEVTTVTTQRNTSPSTTVIVPNTSNTSNTYYHYQIHTTTPSPTTTTTQTITATVSTTVATLATPTNVPQPNSTKPQDATTSPNMNGTKSDVEPNSPTFGNSAFQIIFSIDMNHVKNFFNPGHEPTFIII